MGLCPLWTGEQLPSEWWELGAWLCLLSCLDTHHLGCSDAQPWELLWPLHAWPGLAFPFVSDFLFDNYFTAGVFLGNLPKCFSQRKGRGRDQSKGIRRLEGAESRRTFLAMERTGCRLLSLGLVDGLPQTLHLLKENAKSQETVLFAQVYSLHQSPQRVRSSNSRKDQESGPTKESKAREPAGQVQRKAEAALGFYQPSASAPSAVFLCRVGPSHDSCGCILTYQMVCWS